MTTKIKWENPYARKVIDFKDIDVTDILNQAEEFYAAACSLGADLLTRGFKNEKSSVSALWPSLVSAYFAAELYFKVLYFLKVGNYPRGREGHNLFLLFKNLPDENAKSLIISKYDNPLPKRAAKRKALQAVSGNTWPTFEELLMMNSDGFVEFRYDFEYLTPNSISYAPGEIAEILRKVVRQLYGDKFRQNFLPIREMD